jgi:hypothetical protein
MKLRSEIADNSMSEPCQHSTIFEITLEESGGQGYNGAVSIVRPSVSIWNRKPYNSLGASPAESCETLHILNHCTFAA